MEEDPQNKNLFLNSQFYDNYIKNGVFNFEKARLFLKNCNIFLKEKIFLPVLSPKNHWTLVMINMVQQTVRFYDSLYDENDGHQVNVNVLNWIAYEASFLNYQSFNISNWFPLEGGRGVPQQHNDVDCGVFVIMFMDYLSRNLSVTSLHQQQMSLYRKKIGISILQKSTGKRVREEEFISDILLTFKNYDCNK
jgi:sentrin-specific protease 1